MRVVILLCLVLGVAVRGDGKMWKKKKGYKWVVKEPKLVYVPQMYHQPAYHQPAYHQPAYHQPTYHQPQYETYQPSYEYVPQHHYAPTYKHKKPKKYHKDLKEIKHKVFWGKAYVASKLLAKKLPLIVKILAKKSKKAYKKKHSHESYGHYGYEHHQYAAPSYQSYGHDTKHKYVSKEHNLKPELKEFGDNVKSVDIDNLVETLKKTPLEKIPVAVLETLISLLPDSDEKHLAKEVDSSSSLPLRLHPHEVTSKELISLEALSAEVNFGRHVRQAHEKEGSSYTSYTV